MVNLTSQLVLLVRSRGRDLHHLGLVLIAILLLEVGNRALLGGLGLRTVT